MPELLELVGGLTAARDRLSGVLSGALGELHARTGDEVVDPDGPGRAGPCVPTDGCVRSRVSRRYPR